MGPGFRRGDAYGLGWRVANAQILKNIPIRRKRVKEPVGEQAGERKAARFEAKAVKADGSFEGYASLFGAEDLGRDVVMPGAFRKSLLKRSARGVKLLYQHEPNEVIGTWEKIEEDARGLFVRGQLLTDVRRAREVLALMRAGAVDGLSIGYHVVNGRDGPRERHAPP